MLSFTFHYASFWRRAAALLIDLALLAFVSFLLLQPFIDFLGLREASSEAGKHPFAVTVLRTYGVWAITTLLGSWLYFAFQESSFKQATIGKRLMGLMVFTRDEERLSFAQASGRFFARLISLALLGIGFLLALLDGSHRTLHDMMLDTQVLQPRHEAMGSAVTAG